MGSSSTTAKTVFLEALEIASGSERQAMLAARCGGDAELRREVDELLAHHDQVAGFMDSPPTEVVDLADTARGAHVAPAPTLSLLSPAQRPGSLGRLGHYEILQVIGSGGFGVVLKAHDEKLQRVVAIKLLAESLASSATARKRFIREAQNAAAVRHDNVVGIFAVEETGAIPYLVMELVDGISLEDKLLREGPLELKEVLRIGLQIADGLAAAHKQGLVHRDVKPANILLENGIQRVKITDFGLARGVDDASLTQTGLIAGTPAYMSPEQARGERVDARSDLFSLGSVLYALCTGQVPFPAGSSLGVAKKVCEETPRPIAELNPAIPPWLSEIVERLHAKDPAGRFQSAREVAGLLGNYLTQVQQASMGLPAIVTAHRSQQDPKPQRHGQPSPGARRWLAVIAAALVLMVALLGFTEAQGVTQLAATIIRIFTPDGTLVVEVSDPAVKVTVEGDGGLVVSGAGLHEVRLKPGKYQLRADKDGQRVPLSQELVTITRGDRQVVGVRLELTPQDANTWGQRGRSHSGLNQLDEAIADFDKAIELGPRIASLWADRGDVYAKRQDWDRAIADCSEAVRLDPNAQWICSALMSKYAQAQRFDQAALAADQALSVLPVAEDAWRDNPPLVVAAAEWKEIFERLVKLRPQDPRPRAVRIELLASRGQWQEATELLPALIELDGANHWTWYSASVLHLQTGNAEGYRHVSGEMLKRFGATTDVFIADRTSKTLLLVPGAAADVELPRKLALRAAGGAPSNQWFQLTVGLAEYRAGNFEAAELWLRKSISTPAREAFVEAPSQVLMAMSQHRLGRKDEAIESLKHADQLIAQRVPKLASGLFVNWGDWIRLDLLRREAAALIEPKSERGSFVVLGANGVAERRSDTLADAVLRSSDGDTIEIRGNGPFTIQPMRLMSARVIRAGKGFSPVIKVDAQPVPMGNRAQFFESTAPLVLEGLEFQPVSPNARAAVTTLPPVPSDKESGALYVSNCRFIGCGLMAQHVSACQIRNCAVYQDGSTIGFYVNSARLHAVVDNNIAMPSATGAAVAFAGIAAGQRLTLTRNFLGGNVSLTYAVQGDETVKAKRLVSLESSQNVWSGRSAAVRFSAYRAPPLPEEISSGDKLETLLRQVIDWQEHSNLYPEGVSLLSLSHGRRGTLIEPTRSYQSLTDWNQLWGVSDTASIQGGVRCQGGDVLQKLALAPEKVTLQDFRLRDDSAGYRAGPNGKDLGPDIDLVGPGDAYERWKQTPEYQQWLKDSGQLVAETSQPQAGAFVILGGSPAAEQKFATLAEAVQKSSDGDTIEIRVNGPFVTPQLSIATALTIRAGAGYRPVIQSFQGAGVAFRPHFKVTRGPLILEGLEFQGPPTGGPECTFIVQDAPCYVANCRFSRCGFTVTRAPSYQVRNSHFSTKSSSSLIVSSAVPGPTQVVDNNLITNLLSTAGGPGARIDIRRNLLTGTQGSIAVAASNPSQEKLPVGLYTSQNIFVGTPILRFTEPAFVPLRTRAPSGAELETVIRSVIHWQEDGNLYSEDVRFLTLSYGTGPKSGGGFGFASVEPTRAYNTLSQWNEFWSQSDTRAIQGRAQFQGGDAVYSTPYTLKPDDFRLREGSAGYRAGPDGKDLGPDIDLVGPGEAYERWKTTPEYQKWLEETGQKNKTGR